MKPLKPFFQTTHPACEREEQSALRDYVAALRALEEARRRYEALDDQILAAWHDFRRILQRDSAPMEISRVQDYCEMLQVRQGELALALQAARQQANRAFTRYLAVHQACALGAKGGPLTKPPRVHARHRPQPKVGGQVLQRSHSLAQLICRHRGTIWN